MRVQEVRLKVLADHESLREQLGVLCRLARGVIRCEESGGVLRREADALLETLSAHHRWVDVHLVPALRAEKCEVEPRVIEDHRRRRLRLETAVEQLTEGSATPDLLAREVLDLVGILRADMEAEEELILDSDALPEDFGANALREGC
jgi:hypothetical protein